MRNHYKYWLIKICMVVNVLLLYVNSIIFNSNLNALIIPSCNITILFVALKINEHIDESKEENGKEE
jgi:hypothetical protein